MNCSLLTLDKELISVFDAMKVAGALCYTQGVKEESLIFIDVDNTSIPECLPFPFVMISQNQENAVKAYDNNALDFLLKPVSQSRLMKTLNRARDYQNTKEKNVDTLLVKNGNQHLNILHNNIYFIEALSDYAVIHSTKGKIIVNSSLKKLEERLDGYAFLRVQRSFIVNCSQVESIENNSLSVAGKKVPIGASFKKKIINYLIQQNGVIG